MKSVYTAHYVCKQVIGIGLPTEMRSNVTLGLPFGNGSSDITVKGTLPRFVEGKMYVVNISEAE